MPVSSKIQHAGRAGRFGSRLSPASARVFDKLRTQSVDPTRGRANVGGDVFEKSDDVVVRAPFNFGDLIDLELSFLANSRGVFFRDQTQPRHRFAGDGFDFEPDLKFAFIRPDGAHLRSGITVNHPGNIKALPKAGKGLLQKENAPVVEPPERLQITFPN